MGDESIGLCTFGLAPLGLPPFPEFLRARSWAEDKVKGGGRFAGFPTAPAPVDDVGVVGDFRAGRTVTVDCKLARF